MALVEMSVVEQLSHHPGAPNRWVPTLSSSDCAAAMISIWQANVFHGA